MGLIFWGFITVLWLYTYGPAFVFMAFFALAVHEASHAVAMKYTGVGVKSFTFIPLGLMLTPMRVPKSMREEFIIAFAGPLGGSLALILYFFAWELTQNPVWFSGIWFAAVLNAFNLIPVFPLDGGRVAYSLLARLPCNVQIALHRLLILLFLATLLLLGQFFIFILLSVFLMPQMKFQLGIIRMSHHGIPEKLSEKAGDFIKDLILEFNAKMSIQETLAGIGIYGILLYTLFRITGASTVLLKAAEIAKN